MNTEKPTFESFLAEVPIAFRPFALALRQELSTAGWKEKMEQKPSGTVLTYAHPKTRRSLLNLLRKPKGLMFRMYPDHLPQYMDLLNNMPPSLAQAVAKAPTCKSLAAPGGCSELCVKGYDFVLQGQHYQKCRYRCFEFWLREEDLPFLQELLRQERLAREPL